MPLSSKGQLQQLCSAHVPTVTVKVWPVWPVWPVRPTCALARPNVHAHLAACVGACGFLMYLCAGVCVCARLIVCVCVCARARVRG